MIRHFEGGSLLLTVFDPIENLWVAFSPAPVMAARSNGGRGQGTFEGVSVLLTARTDHVGVLILRQCQRMLFGMITLCVNSVSDLSETEIMGKYKKGDHVKIEVKVDNSPVSEWVWMLVDESDDERQLVFGSLDNEPVANPDMALGQKLAVSYNKIREHRAFDHTARYDAER